MELKKLAQRLEGQGRGGDTMLMHVNPTELQILEAMLGKTTTNPQTGLQEAFSWKKMLAGLGVGAAVALTGGAALGPLMPFIAPLIGAGSLASGFMGGKKKESTASEAGKYLDERTAQRVKDQYKFAPPTQMYQSPGYRPDLLGRQTNHYVRPLGGPLGSLSDQMMQGEDQPGYAKGGLTEAAAKETVLAMLAKMQDQQQPQQPMGMAAGRMVKGGGTGLSDSIPAQLEGQPVRLADGEYVIPADVVSMMGDGSTDAGGRRLDDLIAKVRVEKTGTKKQAGKLSMRKAGK
jgi:hypothetical protein